MERLLEEHGIKPTPNRILVARALEGSGRPLSLMELEERLETVDKSNIFRTLSLFKEHHLVHTLEDSGEGVRYELCHAHDEGTDDDLHIHFHCENCHRTFCLYDNPVPQVEAPEGYRIDSASFLLKGLCPECAARQGLQG